MPRVHTHPMHHCPTHASVFNRESIPKSECIRDRTRKRAQTHIKSQLRHFLFARVCGLTQVTWHGKRVDPAQNDARERTRVITGSNPTHTPQSRACYRVRRLATKVSSPRKKYSLMVNRRISLFTYRFHPSLSLFFR